MFFESVIRRRLSSLLQPWLRDVPELELKLGLINSLAIAKNLSLNTGALNQLTNDDGSFYFEEVNVEHLSLCFSNWSARAFTFDVRGVHVKLSFREMVGSSRQNKKTRNAASEDVKKRLCEIDPEGSSLHDVLEKILDVTPSRNQFATSFLNLVLRHCYLQMLSINVQLQFPISSSSLVYISEIKELNAESQYPQHGCFLRGIVGALIRPLKESSLNVNGSGFKIGHGTNDHMKLLGASNEFFTSVKLYEFQLVNFHIHSPELNFLFSPLDLSVFALLNKQASKESTCARNGRSLWKLALRRIGYVISAPRLSLHNLVSLLSLWMRYVSAYENLLSLLGYSADNLLIRSAVKMSKDRVFLSSAKNNWELICDIEKELPPEAVAQARRIARYRAALHVQDVEERYKVSSVNSHYKPVCKIIALVTYIWKVLCRMIHLIVHLLIFWKTWSNEPDSDRDVVASECSYLHFCFILSLGKILVTINPENLAEPVLQRLQSHIGISYLDLLSFCLSVDELIIMHTEEISEKCLNISCGKLKVTSSASVRAPSKNGSQQNGIASSKGPAKQRVGEVTSVLWSEPAQIFPLSGTDEIESTADVEDACDLNLEHFIRKMSLNWKKLCTKFEESGIGYSENPWLLCEIKSFLTYPELENPDSGFWKCNLTVGKLNLAFGYMAIVSLTLLLQQLTDAVSWNGENEGARLSGSSQSVKNQPDICWDDKYESYASRMKMFLFRILPERHIQTAILIAGPHIKISLAKLHGGNGNVDGQDDFHLKVDFDKIELLVCPSSKSDLASSNEWIKSGDAAPVCIRLQEPQVIDILKSNTDKFSSQGWISIRAYLNINGLNAYFWESVERQPNQIFALNPMTIHSSSIREYVHSLTTTLIAFSTAFCAVAAGFTCIAFMDELYVFFQVIVDSFSALSYVLNKSQSALYAIQELPKQDMVSGECENMESNVKRAPLIFTSTLLLLNGTFKLKSVGIIFQNSRMKNKTGSVDVFDVSSGQKFADDLSDCGFWISADQTCIDISCEEHKMEVLINLSGIKSVMIGYEDQKGKSLDQYAFSNLLLIQSHNCLYELSLSNCIFTLWFGCPQNTSPAVISADPMNYSSSVGDTSNSVESFLLTSESEKPIIWPCGHIQNWVFASDTCTLVPSQWALLNVAVGEIVMARCSLKNNLVGAHKVSKILSSLSVGGEFQRVSWGIQGGLILLEVKSFEVFVRCFSSYFNRFSDILSTVQSSTNQFENGERDVNRSGSDNHFIGDSAQGTQITCQEAERALAEDITMNVAQFSLVLVIEDQLGIARELVLEFDAHLKLGRANTHQNLIINFSRLSILSQVLESVKNDCNVPHFSSGPSNDVSFHSLDGKGTVAVQRNDGDAPVDGASGSKSPISANQLSKNNFASDILCLRHQNYILKHLGAFVTVEKVENVWVGSGSISGCEMTVSLSELQMILSTVSLFSEIYNKEIASEMTNQHGPIDLNQENDSTLDAMVPDGAIVAIQDVHQHTYFTVEDRENKYTLAGAVHYSLVGDRALFKVKYHKQRRWMSSILWFSLISLYAKSESGLPLRLNYRRGSYLVDISGSDDSSWALWRTISCESEAYKSGMDWEPKNELVKGTFFLVNKKNDCAVAFVDAVPEFVQKPGNPFKFKVLGHLSLTRDIITSNGVSLDASGTNLTSFDGEDKGQIYRKCGGFPCIDIAIDKVSLTIVHELPDTKNRFPLLCGCIKNIQLTIQILTNKARIISTSQAFLTYFDAQKNLWRELLHPVDICVYCRSTSLDPGLETVLRKVPVHIYCRTKMLEIFLTELSLDILLFAIGKLNLAGPYSVRSSKILANCCKVENQSGLNLQCHFQNQQRVTLSKKQSTSIFLSPSTLGNQPPDAASVVSIQLFAPGSFTTSSIHLSVLEGRSLAWRTRILSTQGSRTYPGPFIVVDISRKSEDGLSVVVSPLIRIHNGTEFSMELRFRRPQENEDNFASALLRPGDTVDDSMAVFDAINSSGGLKKALMSFSVGNFLFSFRPESLDSSLKLESSLSFEWSEELKGGKTVRLSGIFDKLSYEVRKALLVEAEKCSFSTTHCTLISQGECVGSMHFLIQTIRREVPITEPDNSNDGLERRSVPIALQEQKEIFLLPTLRVSNLLHLEIAVLITESDPSTSIASENIGKQAMISCGATTDFYVNPAIMYFSVTLAAFKSSCKPINSSDWVKKLLKHKTDVRCLDVNLDFGAGKYFASLRLSRGRRGVLEAAIFTSYTLRNESDDSLFFCSPSLKPLSRDEVGKFHCEIPPELGLLLPPKSTGSWFLKFHKVRLQLLEDHSYQALLDLDTISGLTEIRLQTTEGSGVNIIRRYGVSVGPSLSTTVIPSQSINIVPRYVVVNESEESIIVRQCDLEDDMAGSIHINSKQRTAVQLRDGVYKKREFSLFETLIRKHRTDNDNSSIYIQFQLDEPEWGWSGPLCISSLGRFFLKFRKRVNNEVTAIGTTRTQFAAIYVAEEGSTLMVHFHRPPNVCLPYRIENRLCGTSITYYQKNSSEPEVLGPGCSVDYAWDDLTLPHMLVVLINGIHILREINLDKVRSWKPFSKLKQQRRLTSQLLSDKRSADLRNRFDEFNGMEMVNMGYEVRAEGPTRILRVCEYFDSCKGDTVFQFCAKIQLRLSISVHLLEHRQQDLDGSDASFYTPILVAKLKNINLDSVFTDQQKYNQICLQSLDVEEKWVGAPFGAMLRRHRLDNSDSNDCVLKIVFVLLSTSSNVKQVKNTSIVLQPIDLNLDEETLMRIVSFWRTSLSDSKSQSQQYYFVRFEIHPIKIIANFLPGDSYSSYNTAQETLRSLLHSVVKVPSIKNMVVELNGILVTHVLITTRELITKCGQHYFWYVMRSIYIAKGSPLLPPAFASIFDDSASSSLDVFFDPSKGLMNLPGVTLGTFKFISKCIDGKGFSGTKRYFGDLHKTLRTAGSNVLFAAVTEISDSILKGAEASGFDGLVSGFHQGILKLAMEPSLLGTALMGGGPNRKIKLDRSPGIDELYIEGYLQAMLDSIYRQEYLRVRVIDNEVLLKNLPPNNALIEEIMGRVKEFLASKALLKGDPSTVSRPLRHIRGESEWRIGPTVLTLFEHLFVSYAIRLLRKQADKLIAGIKWNRDTAVESDDLKAVVPSLPPQEKQNSNLKSVWKWGIGKFLLSGIAAYIDGRLCRNIPNPVARRIVGGFLLSFLDRNDSQ